jgi:hypothetical protein
LLNFINEVLAMNYKTMLTIPIITGLLAFVSSWSVSAQDKYTVKVPNGLSFSEDTSPGRLSPSVKTDPLWLWSWLIR